ncbi:class I SAM-dependent methyltransferase [Acinetobacter rathckeae]|uniref:class I SAM-dependent methyltransferase n=1 Tax=Acinetobacter rathckeae TaxID=2605272 RepID=UPI0018A317E4|nr:SAM-dependent methyltransferase [Acinetobacter rathckeae]MBF7686782.1 SAM-dependent methyltransferase [Acinetobacter rathckeae]MBF7695686.1 SAM-dependent methyltransferase [Acinetobacter rathckeae]
MSKAILPSPQAISFVALLRQCLDRGQFDRLILSQYVGEEADLEKITFRLVEVQQQQKLSVLYRYKTQDVTKNYNLEQGIAVFEALFSQVKQANLWELEQQVQFKRGKKRDLMTIQPLAKQKTLTVKHDREKQRLIEQTAPYLQELGITDHAGVLVPSMAKKWKQINKFIEIFSQALSEQKQLKDDVNVVDFGSGKGYLTFAMYDYLQKNKWKPKITGVELRENLVQFCQDVAVKNNFQALDFFEGDVRNYQPERLDVMVALHACDIATDFAIHCGIRLNASLILCAPCCHKELRPQLTSPNVVQPMLQYGVHAGQQAEMLTDTIRALLLNAYGYETKVFEFVALSHTNKNKMILAVKKKHLDKPDAKIMQQIQDLKAMYGIQTQSLERLLANELVDEDKHGCRC